MREFVITTETNSDLPVEFVEQHQIGIIPHYYTIEDEVYGDGRELTIREFYDAMRAQKKAATMASNPAVIYDKFADYAKEGKDILHISFSSALSGGYGNIVMVAGEIKEEYPEMNIIVVDTMSASLGEGMLIKKAVDMRAEGKSIEETAAVIEELKNHLKIQFIVDDLNHLFRGGRLSRTSAILGTVANIKPILEINNEGKLVAAAKVRGSKKAMATIVDNMEANLGSYKDKQIFIGIMHGDAEEEAEYFKKLIQERFGYEEFVVVPIGPSIGAHSGPGTVGIVYLGE